LPAFLFFAKASVHSGEAELQEDVTGLFAHIAE
jgi:hypothetical protein